MEYYNAILITQKRTRLPSEHSVLYLPLNAFVVKKAQKFSEWKDKRGKETISSKARDDDSVRNKEASKTTWLRHLHWRVLLVLNSPFSKYSPYHSIFGSFLFK